MTSGSISLRHKILSQLGLNIIGISDSQFAQCKSGVERTAMVGSIIGQFINELELKKREIPKKADEEKRLREVRSSWSSRDQEKDEWNSRTGPVPKNKSFDRVSGWASRDETNA